MFCGAIMVGFKRVQINIFSAGGRDVAVLEMMDQIPYSSTESRESLLGTGIRQELCDNICALPMYFLVALTEVK